MNLDDPTLVQWLLMGGIPAAIVWAIHYFPHRKLEVTGEFLSWTFLMIAFGPFTAVLFFMAGVAIVIWVCVFLPISMYEKYNGGKLFTIGGKGKKGNEDE